MHNSRTRPLATRTFLRLALLLIALAAVDRTSAVGQTADEPTRSSVLEAARDAKDAESAPPERSKVERALYWYDNQYLFAKILGGWNGFHLAGGDFPAGAGMKYGVGFRHTFGSDNLERQPNRVGVDTVAASSTRGYTRLSGALSIEQLGGTSIGVTARGQYYEFPQEDFFGLGMNSREEDRTDYLLESTEAGVDLRWRPLKLLTLGSGVSYVHPTVDSGTDTRFPSIEELFDAATLPGAAAEPEFVRSDASIAVDWRDNPLHPHTGGRYGIEFSDFRDQNLDAFGFRRVAIDVQQYVPLPNRYRVIALRAAAILTDPLAGQQVPFYYQPTLGGSSELRGFREFRFRDRNSLALTAEYRWEASWLLDGALFVDAGKVAADRGDLTLRDLNVSYGVGFRVHSNNAFVTRLDLARSREGFIPLLRFEHVF